MHRRVIRRALVCALAALSAAARAASVAPKEDLHFFAEHLAEAAQDARYFALPWPEGRRGEGWRPLVALGAARFSGEPARAEGRLFTLGAERTLDARWSIALAGFHDRFAVRGEGFDGVLTSGALDVPLDLPAQARIHSPEGGFRHLGLAAVARRALDGAAGGAQWSINAGVLLERLVLDGYRFQYTLVSGADAGAAGAVDYSGANNFVTPFAGVQREQRIGAAAVFSARAAFGVPLPAGRFDTRISGPGFAAASAPGAGAGRIGDGFLVLGAGVREPRSGLEIDLGALLLFGPYERLTHEGVNRGWLLNLAWRGR